jgi:hypothetical protein
VLKRVVQALAFGLACVFASVAFAEAEEPLKRVADDIAAIFADVRITPLDDGQLEDLRGRLPGPTTVHTVGVVLWDEPRKGAPPQRGNSESPPPTGLTGGVFIQR